MLFRMGLIGRKVGMTHVFIGGNFVPVTVLQLGPCTVVQKKTPDAKDGYGAIQLGYGVKKHKKLTKGLAGHFRRRDLTPFAVLREIRVPDDAALAEYAEGQVIDCSIFTEGEFIDVTGTTKGKGFQGVMKRHNMKGAKQATHGTHEYFRHVGSIGCRSTPGRVHPGKHLPGHMGDARQTIQNLKVVKIDVEKNVVLIRGSLPGAPGSLVMVRRAVKKFGRKKVAA